MDENSITTGSNDSTTEITDGVNEIILNEQNEVVFDFAGAMERAESALSTVSNTSSNDPNTVIYVGDPLSGENIPRYAHALKSTNPAIVLDGVIWLRKLLSIEKSPLIQDVIDSGAVSDLVTFLRSDDNPVLQFQSSWTLTNIASGTSEQTRVIIEAGAVPEFIRLIQSPSADVKDQVIWALGNIAGDSVSSRDFVLNSNIVPAIANMVLPTDVMHVRNLTWCCSNLCKGKPGPHLNTILPFMSLFQRYIFDADTEVISNCLWALSYISDGPHERIQAVINANVCGRIVALLSDNNLSSTITSPALRTVGNIVTGDDEQTQHVLDLNIVESLKNLIDNFKQKIRIEALWTISNITAGSVSQIQTVIDCGIISRLNVLLLNENVLRVQKEATWALSNALTRGNFTQVLAVVEAGAVQSLSHMLSCDDDKLVIVAVEGLEKAVTTVCDQSSSYNTAACDLVIHLLELHNGLEKITDLQYHPLNAISGRCRNILHCVQEYRDAQDNLQDEEELGLFAAGDECLEEGEIPPPSEFMCPISFKIMKDPVQSTYGQSYEKYYIMKWLRSHNTCPFSRKPLNSKQLKPNDELREQIEAWKISLASP